MINKRLIGTVNECRKYIAGNVLFQWISLAANIGAMAAVTSFLGMTADASFDRSELFKTLCIVLTAMAVRAACFVLSGRMSYLSSKTVKQKLRTLLYQKLLRLGSAYKEQVNTAEIVQVAVEGVDQLETYFGSYLPQFFYAMLAPLTLFAVVCRISPLCAVVLLICVPLIPVSIVAVQRFAKKLLAKYWGQYTALGDTFLENLQGLTTLKIYQADEYKQKEMNDEAEKFRKITMKVLSMQLNSITVMDLIAYGGAALGIVLAVGRYQAGVIRLSECLLIILLSADFFLPMRMLGSFFHIAMNGMAAGDKIFRLLDLPEEQGKTLMISGERGIACRNLGFSYEENREVLHDLHMVFPEGSFTSIVGASGSGKSTIASILMGRSKGYAGSVTIGGLELREIREDSLLENLTYIGHQSYLFKGTVRENLLMGCPDADDDQLWTVLEQVNLSAFLKAESGLDTMLNEKASNLSGGQCQRLALARALLHDSGIYIFDEAASNIDIESENIIMDRIHELAKGKTILLISHRLANVMDADNIYVLENGHIVQSGTHAELLREKGVYERLWCAQQELESFAKGGVQI